MQTKAAAPVQQKPARQQPKNKKSDGPVSTIRLGTEAPAPKSRDVVVKEVEVLLEMCDKGLVGLLKDIESEQNEKKKTVFGIDSAHPDVHPAILMLGMQINKHAIVGSSAMCLGFSLAIKRVIEAASMIK